MSWWIALAVVAAVLAGSVFAVFGWESGSSGGGPAAGTRAPSTSVLDSPTAVTPPWSPTTTLTGVSSSQSSAAHIHKSPSVNTPSLPATTADIDLAGIRDDPRLAAVADVLDTYFSGVNDHDPARAASVFAPGGAIDPSDSKAVHQFGRGIRTSHDDRIVVVSIHTARVGGQHGALIRVTFRSHQEAALGPKHQSCTNWALTYRAIGTALLLELLDAVDVASHGC